MPVCRKIVIPRNSEEDINVRPRGVSVENSYLAAGRKEVRTRTPFKIGIGDGMRDWGFCCACIMRCDAKHEKSR